MFMRIWFLVVILLVLCLASCGTRRWAWRSDLGRTCFYHCESRRSQCAAYCGGGIAGSVCADHCSDTEYYCNMACPDLNLVEDTTVDMRK